MDLNYIMDIGYFFVLFRDLNVNSELEMLKLKRLIKPLIFNYKIMYVYLKNNSLIIFVRLFLKGFTFGLNISGRNFRFLDNRGGTFIYNTVISTWFSRIHDFDIIFFYYSKNVKGI